MSAQAAVSTATWLKPVHYGVFAVLAVLIVYAPTFISMAQIWSRDATFAHGYAIPLLSGWLLWQRRRHLANAPIAPARRAAWWVAALILVWIVADVLEVQVLRQAAATALIPAAVWVVLGREFVRRAVFPLAYLAFAVPFGDALVPTLIKFTTEFTVFAVRLVGVPIFRDGTFFSLPSGNFEVVKACSGVRYLIASLALGTLYAGVTYNDWRRRAGFIALSIVVPILANGVRAFGIVMIAHLSDMRYAVGFDHLIYGWIFFGLVMGLLFWIGGRFAPGQAPTPTATVNPAAPARVARSGALQFALVVFGMTLLLGPLGSELWRTAADDRERSGGIALLPPAGHPWQGPLPVVSSWQPAFAASADVAMGQYDSTQGRVLVFAREYRRKIDAETALTGAALIAQEQSPWRVAATGSIALSARARANTAEVVNFEGQRFDVWIWYLVEGEYSGSATHAKWRQLRAWLQLRRPVSRIVAVVTPRSNDLDAKVRSQRLLEEFVRRHAAWLGVAAAL